MEAFILLVKLLLWIMTSTWNTLKPAVPCDVTVLQTCPKKWVRPQLSVLP